MNRIITATLGRQSGGVITVRDVQLYEKHPGVPCNYVVSAQGAGYLPMTEAEIDEHRAVMSKIEIAREEVQLAGFRKDRAIEAVEDLQTLKSESMAAVAAHQAIVDDVEKRLPVVSAAAEQATADMKALADTAEKLIQEAKAAQAAQSQQAAQSPAMPAPNTAATQAAGGAPAAQSRKP